MTTTVRLLATYDGSPPQTLRDLPDALATSFVAAGNASLDLTGGVRRYRPAPPPPQAAVPTLIGTTVLTANQKTEIQLPEGTALQVSGAASTVGTVQRLDAAGTVLQSWTVGAGALAAIGPYTGAQRVAVSCDFGAVTLTSNLVAALLPQIIVSSAAPNNADGRPDGTIYIQTAP